jgi:hypothetical protein
MSISIMSIRVMPVRVMPVRIMPIRVATTILCLLLALPAFAQTRPNPTEVPFTVVSAKNVRFATPLRMDGMRGAAAEKRLDRAFLVRVEVPAEIYDGLPPSIEPFLYIGRRELRTYSIERPPGGRTLFVTYYLPGGADTGTFDHAAPMVITTEHGRPARELQTYRSRSDLAPFQSRWTRTP